MVSEIQVWKTFGAVLLVLLISAEVIDSQQVESKTRKSYTTKISAAAMETGNITEEITCANELVCAIAASKRPWVRTACYTTDNKCILSDIFAPAIDQQDSTDDAIENCQTTLGPGGCYVNTTVAYSEDEVLAINCSLFQCLNNQYLPYYMGNGASTCSLPFVNVPYLGCVHINLKKMTWCDAKSYCANLDSLLVAPTTNEYIELQVFLAATALFGEVWVGVEAGKWINGEDVQSDQWYPGNPDEAPDACGAMTFHVTLIPPPAYKVDDKPCENEYYPVCHRPAVGICTLSVLDCALLMIG